MICKTDPDKILAGQIMADTITPRQQLYRLPLTGLSKPDRLRQVFLNSFSDLNGKQIKGISATNNLQDISTQVNFNGVFTTLDTDQLASIMITFYDIRKSKFSVLNLPLATLVQNSNFKTPYKVFDIVPDMNKSYITIAGTSAFNPLLDYILLLNFIYI